MYPDLSKSAAMLLDLSFLASENYIKFTCEAWDAWTVWDFGSPLSEVASEDFGRDVEWDVLETAVEFSGLLFVGFLVVLCDFRQGDWFLIFRLSERNADIFGLGEMNEATFLW